MMQVVLVALEDEVFNDLFVVQEGEKFLVDSSEVSESQHSDKEVEYVLFVVGSFYGMSSV